MARAVSEITGTWYAGGGRKKFTQNETQTGVYTLWSVSIGTDQQYRLRIRTSNGREYLSDYVAVKRTPPIQSVDWTAGDDGVRISVTTQDPENNTWYYRWELEETWEFMTPFAINYIFNKRVQEPVTENISRCRKQRNPTDILLGTSARLSQALIYQFPLISLPPASEKHQIRYSILVRQAGLTREGFEYWQNLQKNTENLSGLFDPQPSQLTCNIRAVNDPAGLVFGYFSAYSVAEKRIFINRNQLPSWRRNTGFDDCTRDTLKFADYTPAYFNNARFAVIEEYLPESRDLLGYITASDFCVDCRLSGTNVRPSFW